jgi:hypothetical protein
MPNRYASFGATSIPFALTFQYVVYKEKHNNNMPLPD